jgi:signal transduction histidine kinase
MGRQARAKKGDGNESIRILDMLSHDLGNSAHMALAKLDMMGPDGIGRKASLDDIGREITSMHRLVKNVRNAVQARHLPYRPEDVDIFKAVQLAREDVSRYFGSAPVVEIISSEPELSVRADRLLKEALAELMMNSMGSWGDGPCRITIGFERSSGRVRIIYEDLSKDVDLSRIEHSMDRLDRLLDEGDYHGTGTGLSMVKAIIERYGGTITVDRRKKGDPSSGSSFVIDLPG